MKIGASRALRTEPSPSRRRGHALALLCPLALWAGACGLGGGEPADPEPDGPSFVAVLESATAPPPTIPQGSPELWQQLEGFYERTGQRPAWVTATGPGPQAEVLVSHLQRAEQEGLRSEDYGTQYLAAAAGSLSRRSALRELHQLDIALTYAALHFGDHLLRGRVRAEEVDLRWRVPGREQDLVEILATALAPEGDLGAALDSLRPSHPQYRMLAAHHGRYRRIVEQGGWPTVPEGPVLSPGESGDAERLHRLAERLRMEGFLEGVVPAIREATDAEGGGRAVYGDELVEAVSRFQRSRTLAEDGALGPETQKELNVPAFERLAQIELNLERWRWMPEDLGSPAVLVNIPGYWLEVWEEGMPVMSMNVAVGEEGWETPIFSDRIQYLVLNPDWNLPENIVQARVFPAMRQDPRYLEANEMEVLRGWEPNAPRVSDDLVFQVGEEPGLRVRRRPGPNNPLGRVKFMFPNEFAIYLHDTPASEELVQPERNLSHGCVRLERPLELAEYLLRPDGWDRGRLERAIATGETRDVGLTRKMPIYIVYFTAVVREDGEIELYRDPYRIDQAQLRAQER